MEEHQPDKQPVWEVDEQPVEKLLEIEGLDAKALAMRRRMEAEAEMGDWGEGISRKVATVQKAVEKRDKKRALRGQGLADDSTNEGEFADSEEDKARWGQIGKGYSLRFPGMHLPPRRALGGRAAGDGRGAPSTPSLQWPSGSPLPFLISLMGKKILRNGKGASEWEGLS